MRPGVLLTLALCSSLSATDPTDATRRWWSHVQALANDGMEGRDTGSEGYRRAAAYVATEFERAGLQPAGERGYYQSVPLHVIRLRADQSTATLQRHDEIRKLQWLHDITLTVQPGLPNQISGGMIFAGSELPAGLDWKGKLAVRLGAPVGTPAANRTPAPLPDGVVATLTIDSFDGPERRRWPAAYAVNMRLAEATPAATGNARPALFLNPAAAEELFKGSGHTYTELKQLADAGQPPPTFELSGQFRADLRFEASDIASDNILAVLPGSDPALATEYVAISAHLDGYGFGEPIGGDGLYNGAFDDAAYVATLIDLAQHLRESGTKLRRSLLFVVVTGEEKGLLGSRYYAAHTTVPKERIVANLNLDQLRPIFPLKVLTMLALDESTLGETARQVAEPMGIRIQPDPEPDRNLLRRSDHYNFLQIGVPATGFIFGYEKGSPEEAVYRRWYADRYHSPSDDLKQPWVPEAAAQFNEFFGRLVVQLANADQRPQWKPASRFAPRPAGQ